MTKKGKYLEKPHTNGHSVLTLNTFNFPSYEEMTDEINKKLGKRPLMPNDLSEGKWTEQSLRVLSERYLRKNDDGEVIETPSEMCWRVAWDIASAEVRWGAKKPQVIKTAREFYGLLLSHKFL